MQDRRTILKGAAIGAALPLTSVFSGERFDESDKGFIDAHVHVWTPDLKKYPLAKPYTKASMQPASFTPEELMAHAKPTGVSRVVLIQMSYYGFDNSYMLDVMKEYPGVYSGVAVIDENSSPAATMKKMKNAGVRGFRIRPEKRESSQWLNGKGMKSMWKTGADENLAMCHLIDARFLPSVFDMCKQYPKTPVVIDHFARIGVDGRIKESDLNNLCRLAKYDTVTVKVSAYYALGKKKAPYRDLGPMIHKLVKEFGSDRLMWASDCPFQVVDGHAYAPSVNLIKSGLDFLKPEDRQNILRNTAEKVFFS